MGGLLVKKVPPNYPEEARQARIQGTVMLSADIGKEGNIVNLELLEGPIELAGSAVDAVRRWKYHPYILNGEPVEVHTQVQVNYLLAPH
jgi:protein TonB